MRSAVYASGQAAENHQAPSRQIAPQPLCHSCAVGSRMPRAHDRDSWLRDCFRIPAQVKNQRWIVDLLQLLRIRRVVKTHHIDSCVRRAPQLLICKLDRTSGAKRLRRNRLNARRFQLGEGRLEDILDSAEMLDQLARFRWTQTGSQVERYPMQRRFVRRLKTNSGFGHAHLRVQLAGLYTPVKIAVKVG